MHVAVFGLDLTRSHADLDVTILLDDQVIPSQAGSCQVEFTDTGEHTITVSMAGKTAQHTRLSADGTILQDATVQVQRVTLDSVDVTDLFVAQSRYKHDFNGSGDTVEQAFYGVMGYNGSVSWRFVCPVYRWIRDSVSRK